MIQFLQKKFQKKKEKTDEDLLKTNVDHAKFVYKNQVRKNRMKKNVKCEFVCKKL